MLKITHFLVPRLKKCSAFANCCALDGQMAAETLARPSASAWAVTCVFSGGVGKVEAASTVVDPTHELDGDLVASGLNQLVHLQPQTAVLDCSHGAIAGTDKRGFG